MRKLFFVIWILAIILILYFSFGAVGNFGANNSGGIVKPSVLSRLFKKSDKYDDYKNVITKNLVEEESATIDAVDRVSPAVVSIVVETVSFDLFTGPSRDESGIGTGFIVDSNGLIVTNSHVVDDPRGSFSVVLKDGSSYEVEKIHLDTISDLAILEITARNLPTVELGDSDGLKVGQKAIAIGNALGRYQNTVTVGVVSGIGRDIYASRGFGSRATLQEDVIQTDAALNPGNSGGPLLNLAGQVIGINVATTFGADNISFSIPVNTLKPLLEMFSEEGRIIRPYIGIVYSQITSEIAALRNMPVGAYITRVVEGSPADEAGLERGDIIVEMNGQAVDEEHSIAKLVSGMKVGDEALLKIDREGEEVEVRVVLEEAPEDLL